MATSIRALLMMSLPARLITLRKEMELTQQKMAETIGIHVNSLKKYESGQAQPSLEVLKKIALELQVSTDFLHERGPSDDLALQLEAISHSGSTGKPDYQVSVQTMGLRETSRH